MKKEQTKRNYHYSLDFVESGFHACWYNAQDLVLASQKLLDAGLHATSLSLAVLALEELGKLYAIDGLLFARFNDHKTTTFDKSTQRHTVKLTVLEMLPLLIYNLSRADPRYGKEQRYNQALAISLQYLKKDGNAVMAQLKDDGFLDLNSFKQKGFYVDTVDQHFVAPRDAVEPSFAKAVYQLAWRATTTIDFVLKDGNLERYLENARSIRANMTEEQHQELERLGEKEFKQIFGIPSNEDETSVHEL